MAPSRMLSRRKIRSAALAFAAFLGLCASLVAWIVLATLPYRTDSLDKVPDRPVALVFGAMVYPDGRLSPMLRDRVDGAVALYREGKVRFLLMSGDNSRADYDEVTAMKEYAVQTGVPEAAIRLDYAGFSTYESCYRAKTIFKVDRAVLVTQDFHLPRAVYACRTLGIDAVGFGQPDLARYFGRTLSYLPREAAAQLKAWWQLHVTRPEPTYLGSTEPIE